MGDPLKPCPGDATNGIHEWVAVAKQGTGDPLPGARCCLNCNAFDPGPQDIRINKKDSLVPLFPAATRSYRIIRGHNPDDTTPNADPEKSTGQI
jgi:hypothetical protein